ncbi:MAG: VWA domain-containing protein [Candidatus Binataceae bacterium]
MRLTAKLSGKGAWNVLIAAALGVAIAFAVAVPAAAQQGAPPPDLVLPGGQGQRSSTLELPAVLPPSHQGGGSFTIQPQVPQPGQELQVPSLNLRRQPGYQQVTATVTAGQGGACITGLQKNDFQLYLDGRRQPIGFFREDLNTPVSVGILVDTSGSMTPKIPQVRAAVSQFIRDLNGKDEVFLIAFAARPFMLQPFTTDHDLAIRKLGLLFADGQTALFDSIMQGLDIVEQGRYDKKALLVITDGMDNDSSATVNGIAEAARRMGVLVYSIGIGNPNSSPLTMTVGPFMIAGGGGDQVDAQTLRTLSTETGAKTFIIRTIGDGRAIRNDCETISRELREQYTLGFVAPNAAAGGYRGVRVEVPGRPDAVVRVRKGVVVGSRSRGAAYDPSGGGP